MLDDSLYKANSDILYLIEHTKNIGWNTIKQQSIHRILYLSKVLYSFANDDKNIFEYYHYSISVYGPYSILIDQSLAFLLSNFYIAEKDGGYNTERPTPISPDKIRENWLKTIILILGKYGENKVFGFTINDPLYKESLDSNLQREIDTTSLENKTVKVLNDFKQAFEQSLDNTSFISSEEYIDLYFEYIFSQIIRG
ncbi:hypothetical protein I7H67_04610 [Acinetobacter sp. ACIN00229]|uniref:hypothetical protein n=1 Tax=Acinetobacter sp. ACIN00229 TaxID=2792607 RepID=UPI0018DF6968|nr:hypothetical protein [Acinetobacter sp. ACIN00229]MBI0422082.1 hypothetical protein [Acinetobacter sp. ACIN00229]